MPLSRPSLAFAGSAAVLVVAGVISHQILLAPQPLFSELAGGAASEPTNAGRERAAVPPSPAAGIGAECAAPPGTCLQ